MTAVSRLDALSFAARFAPIAIRRIVSTDQAPLQQHQQSPKRVQQ